MIIRQKFIERADCRANRTCLYIFGDNEEERGLGGQAAIRGEPNALGIPTKKAPSFDPSAYWSDGDFLRVKPLIDARFKTCLKHLATGRVMIIPLDGLGTGRAKLPEASPVIYAYIQKRMAELIERFC